MSTTDGSPPTSALGTIAGPSATDAPPLGLPKPSKANSASTASLTRLNEIVVTALGSSQRDWVRGLQSVRPDGGDSGSLAHRTAERFDHAELRRQLNIEAILHRTMRILPDAIEDGTPDADWAAAFFSRAADTADAETARLWARLLAMEVRRPGSVAPIALDRLPGLSKSVLATFRRFAAFAINTFVVRLSQSFFDGKDVSSDDILLMEEYGLVRTNRDLNRVFQSQKEDRFSTNLLYADKALRVTHDDPGKQLTLACYRLTEFGTVLCRALLEEGDLRSDTDYIVEVVRMLQRQGFQTAQADILERSDEQIVARHTPFCDIVALRR